MADMLMIEVVTFDPSNKTIFINGNVSRETDEIKLMKSLLGKNWMLATSHAFIKDRAVHEKYVFVQS